MKRCILRWSLLLLLLPLLGSADAPPEPKVGMRLKAKAELGADGRLIALSLRKKNPEDDDLELHGVVEQVDLDTRLFSVLGVWSDARGGDLNRRQRRVAQALLPGDWVHLEGDFEDEQLLLDELSRPRGEDRVLSVEGIVSKVEVEGETRRISIGPVLVIQTQRTQLRGF